MENLFKKPTINMVSLVAGSDEAEKKLEGAESDFYVGSFGADIVSEIKTAYWKENDEVRRDHRLAGVDIDEILDIELCKLEAKLNLHVPDSERSEASDWDVLFEEFWSAFVVEISKEIKRLQQESELFNEVDRLFEEV